ncbi:hypothetical protein CB0940_02509 [Cercospora beticola]|uniref:Methyltransferase type 11 domain-containing protein n=1 Tax=Cercospora beticola TaxID=122368 RepID=A0A2G5I344_CERBT|nr:hypothetical protein CB0940_02509 [Cercospora beticola]PIA99168.1 hypothetical protein CB0940_02509 [Cercospora beticola]WPA99649.1 hypothetical protein RHO25_004267 [Cercospora beticola]CAK1362211.1 unnamed protein product [Cercospora beticola]
MHGQVNQDIFNLDEGFWDNYLRGRPSPPDSFFARIFDYHEAKNGHFNHVHDVGAGNGPFSHQLKSRFDHVLVSDIATSNVELARARLGDNGYSYRTAKLEDASDLREGKMDLVFAANVMHFPDQELAMKAIAHQLRPGGTFAAALFGPARFEDPRIQSLWQRMNYEGGRTLLSKSDRVEETIGIMSRTQDHYNVAPLDPTLFDKGSQRIHLNMSKGGIVGMLPPETANLHSEPDYTGEDDQLIHEDDIEWRFTTNFSGLMEHVASFPFLAPETSELQEMMEELEEYCGTQNAIQGYVPVTLILATRS